MTNQSSGETQALEVVRHAHYAAAPMSQPVFDLVTAEVEAEGNLDIRRLIKRYIWLVLTLALLGSIAGFISVIYATPTYGARLLLEMQPAHNPMKAAAGSSEETEMNLQTQILMMRGGAFLKRAVERMQSETPPVSSVRTDFFSKLRSRVRPDTRNPMQIMTEGTQMAAGTLSVRPVNGTRLIEISCESIHPELAANFVNTVAAEFIDQNIQARAIDSQRTSQWLGARVEETKAKLQEAEQKLQDYVRQSGNLFVAQETTLADTTLRSFQGELAGAKAARITAQSRLEQAVKSDPNQLVETMNDPILRSQHARLIELQQQRTLLTTKLTPNHPKVQLLDVQIREVEEQVRKETVNSTQRIKNEFDTAMRREKLLSSAHAGAAGQVSAQASDAAQFMALKREVDILRTTYGSILMQASETSISSSLPSNDMRIVDPASPPTDPIKPKPPMNMAFGAFAGIGLSLGFAFLRERMDRSVKSPGSARELLNLRELGVIPSITGAPARARNLLPAFLKRRKEESVSQVEPGKLSNPELIGWQERSYIAESFRHTLASLMRDEVRGFAPAVVLITSPNPGEGKTLVSSNLSIALAESGRRVLLIDADFRRPRVHAVFGLDNSEGLANVLEHADLSMDPVEHAYIRPSGYERLDVLSNGPSLIDLPKLLHSNRLSILLKRLRNEYDMIIIDAAPVLQIADARVIDQLADGVVLVLRSGSTDRKSALEAYRCLREDGARIIGTILNDWSPSAQKTAYYYSYVSDERQSGTKVAS